MEQNTSPNLFDLHIDQQSSAYLSEAAKWAKFLSIVGFIGCGIIAIIAFFAGTILSSVFGRAATMPDGESVAALSAVSGIFLTIIYLGVAVLFFFRCFYLYKFAVKAQAAIKNNDQEQLVESFKNLKTLYKYIGILTIIVLGLYALALIFFVIGLAMAPRV